MERPSGGIEPPASRTRLAASLGTPTAVAVLVGGSLFLLIALRSGFRGVVIYQGG